MSVGKRIESFNFKDNPSKKRGSIVFVVSFIIAFIFWYLFALNEVYISNLPLKLTYTDLPKDKILVNDLPEEISIRIETEGWSIMKLKRSRSSNSIKLNLSKYANADYLITNRLANSIEFNQIGNFKILDIKPDTINFEFENVSSKKVKVKANTNISFRKQYGYAGHIEINPQTIKIVGPQSIIEKIESVNTTFLELADVHENYNNFIGIGLSGYSNVESVIEQVSITIPVDKMTEGVLYKHIVFSSPFVDSIKLIPGKVKVQYRVAVSNFSNVDTNSFILYVDESSIDSRKNSKLKVNIKSNYSHVFNVRIDPEYVRYLIVK